MFRLARASVVLLVACGTPAAPVAQPTGPMPAVAAPVDPTTLEPAAMPPAPPPAVPPAPVVAPLPPPPPPALATCVPADAKVETAELTPTGVTLCIAGSARSCWLVDFDKASWTPESPELTPDTTVPRVTSTVTTIDAADVKVCSSIGIDCQTVPVTGLTPDGGAAAVASRDRELVAVWQGASLRVFAIATGKMIAAIKPWKTEIVPAAFRPSHFLGGNLAGGRDVLEVLVASSALGAQARLFDPHTGKQLGVIGTHDAEISDYRPIPVGDERWAFASFPLDRLFVHEAHTGKLVKTIELFDAHDRQAAGAGDAATVSLLERTRDGKAIATVPVEIGRWPMVVVELATGKHAAFSPPRCK